MSDRASRPWIKCPPLDAAADTPENLGFFGGCLKWKKVKDDFFHGYLVHRRASAGVMRKGRPGPVESFDDEGVV
jgi:hypothetical protein